jgi:hypothetical protein
MTEEKGFDKNVWLLMLMLSILIVLTLLIFVRGNVCCQAANNPTGSSQVNNNLTDASGFMNKTMLNAL